MHQTVKVMVLSASVGHGHIRAAEALEEAARLSYPDCEIHHVDVLSLTPALFQKAYRDSYLMLIRKLPEVWGYLYSATDQSSGETLFTNLRQKLESAVSKPLFRLLEAYRPDHIVCTHFMPAQVIARWKRKGRLATPLWSCITDFVAHEYWMEPGLTGYFTASEENAFRMRERGLADENIIVSGIPVSPMFRPVPDAAAAMKVAAETFGIAPDRRLILLMGGGAGVGALEELADRLTGLNDDLPQPFQLAVLTGNNKELLERLQKKPAAVSGVLRPLPFTRDVHVLEAAAELVISKPGGLTTVECLAMGKPMLIYAPIPGQEAYNSDYLLENGAAMKAPDTCGLLWRTRFLLEHPEKIRALAANALRIGRPDSASYIVQTILANS